MAEPSAPGSSVAGGTGAVSEVVNPPLSGTLLAVWALFAGLAIMLTGHGLLSTLVGLRATLEGFPPALIGAVMTSLYVGYVSGAWLAPRVVRTVGHVRTFGAMAALAGVTALLHALFVNPWVWIPVRFVTGACMAAMTVVVESWLNDRVSNEMRGRLLAIYVVVMFVAITSGNLLLNIADPAQWKLFALCAILFSLSVIPMLLSASPAPELSAPAPVGLRRLLRTSPLGVAGVCVTGMSNGAFFGMGAVYAHNVGMSVQATSLFMSALLVGGVAAQWPLGWLADRMDRRWLLALVTLAAAAVAVGGALLPGGSAHAPYVISFLIGALSLPMYSLSIAHTNDFVSHEERVATSASLALANGVGSIFGPLSASVLMAAVGPSGLFWFLLVVHASLGLFAFYRMTARAAVPVAEHVPTVALPAGATPVAAGEAAEAAWDLAPERDAVQSPAAP